LPERLISVFGLESSGTTFLAEVLGMAIAAKRISPNDDLHLRTSDSAVEVQHISEPWGFWEDPKIIKSLDTVEFVAPADCMVFPIAARKAALDAAPHAACFDETQLSQRQRYPRRFFVNITSHIQWYRSKGVEATAILVLRDETIHSIGKQHQHSKNSSQAVLEDEHGKKLIVEAMNLLPASHHLVVSYEALMSLRGPYLLHLYDLLGINSTFVPAFKDGNQKYVRSIHDKKPTVPTVKTGIRHVGPILEFVEDESARF
jgi:hypothetical protein